MMCNFQEACIQLIYLYLKVGILFEGLYLKNPSALIRSKCLSLVFEERKDGYNERESVLLNTIPE